MCARLRAGTVWTNSGRLTPTIEHVLDLAFGKYMCWFAFAALIGAVFYLGLTALLVKFFEHKGLSAFGLKWTETKRGNFRARIFMGFLPGKAIALVLAVFGLVEGGLCISLKLLITFFYALNMVLTASRYALQILLRRLPLALAIAFVCLGSSLVAFGNFLSQGWKPTVGLSLTGSVLCSALLGYAFWQRRNLWFPAGIYFGPLLAPTSRELVGISWATRLEVLWSPNAWNFGNLCEQRFLLGWLTVIEIRDRGLGNRSEKSRARSGARIVFRRAHSDLHPCYLSYAF
jgi:hypothetical protein